MSGFFFVYLSVPVPRTRLSDRKVRRTVPEPVGMNYHKSRHTMGKTIIYQMLPRLWGNVDGGRIKGGTLEENGCGKFSSVDRESLAYLKDLGISHVWYTGIIRHATLCGTNGCTPSDRSWVKGQAGSPYAITDYFDVNPYLADDPCRRMEEFENLVERTHEAGLKVIIDFVPNHVARDYGSFSPRPFTADGRDADGHPVLGAADDTGLHWVAENDFFYYPGTPLRLPVKGKYHEFPAKASGNAYTPEPGINDWFDTVKINYCDFHTATWDKMYEAVRFWASKGVDGFRCDMVELVPAEFMQWLIRKIKAEFGSVIFIAEVYQKNKYRFYAKEIGLDYLYDKSGLYDAVRDIMRKNAGGSWGNVEDWQSTRRFTGNWQFLGDLQPRMLNFLENHDEPRFPSEEIGGDVWHGFCALHTSLFLNTAPFMVYFGEEIGERGEDEEGFSGRNNRTSIFDWWRIRSVTDLYDEIHGRPALEEWRKDYLRRFREILRFASEEDAVGKGVTYDLCYCNYESRGFDRDRHFAFIRDYGDSTLLFVCNYSSKDADIDIYIPKHAFDWLGIIECESLNPARPLNANVKAYDASIIRLQSDK